jgi:hypothetical protein
MQVWDAIKIGCIRGVLIELLQCKADVSHHGQVGEDAGIYAGVWVACRVTFFHVMVKGSTLKSRNRSMPVLQSMPGVYALHLSY